MWRWACCLIGCVVVVCALVRWGVHLGVLFHCGYVLVVVRVALVSDVVCLLADVTFMHVVLAIPSDCSVVCNQEVAISILDSWHPEMHGLVRSREHLC